MCLIFISFCRYCVHRTHRTCLLHTANMFAVCAVPDLIHHGKWQPTTPPYTTTNMTLFAQIASCISWTQWSMRNMCGPVTAVRCAARYSSGKVRWNAITGPISSVSNGHSDAFIAVLLLQPKHFGRGNGQQPNNVRRATSPYPWRAGSTSSSSSSSSSRSTSTATRSQQTTDDDTTSKTKPALHRRWPSWPKMRAPSPKPARRFSVLPLQMR